MDQKKVVQFVKSEVQETVILIQGMGVHDFMVIWLFRSMYLVSKHEISKNINKVQDMSVYC